MEIRQGTAQDSVFLGQAIRDAERAHSSGGLWDLLIPDPALVAQVLSDVTFYPESVYFYERFWIVWDIEKNIPIASACGYAYPECCMSKTIPIMTKILHDKYQWNDEDVEKALVRLSILDGSFPSNVDWDLHGPTWMVEAVYTDPNYRRRGLGKLIVTTARSKGSLLPHQCQRCWITCSLGNDAAYYLYLSIGYHLIGDANTVEGDGEFKFHVLEYLYDESSPRGNEIEC